MSVVDAWNEVARPSVKPLVRALYSGGSFVGEVEGRWQFEVANHPHASKCEKHRGEVERALTEAVGRPISIELIVAGQGSSVGSAGASGGDGGSGNLPDQPPTSVSSSLPDDHEVDLSELSDAPPESVQTPLDRLAEAFPGSELVDGD